MPGQVEENAEPAAQAVSDQAIRPAGKAVAENAEPMAKRVTDGALRPAGKAVSDNAVPMTNSVMRDQVDISLPPMKLPCFTYIDTACPRTRVPQHEQLIRRDLGEAHPKLCRLWCFWGLCLCGTPSRGHCPHAKHHFASADYCTYDRLRTHCIMKCLTRSMCMFAARWEDAVLRCHLCMQVQPAVKDAASRAEPAAKDVTQNYIRPAGDYVADNAVPLTKEIGEFSRLPLAPIMAIRRTPLCLDTCRNVAKTSVEGGQLSLVTSISRMCMVILIHS